VLTTPTVPPQITLNFALTSFYPLVHRLSPPAMTLQFFQSTSSANRDPPALRVILTAQPQMSAVSEEGLPVLNVNTGDGGDTGGSNNSTDSSQTLEAAKLLVLPRVINVLQTGVSQNTLSATAFTTDGTFVYYVLALDGAAVETPSSDAVLDAASVTATLAQKAAVHALRGARLQTRLESAPTPVQLNQNTAQIDLDSLDPQTNYVLFLVATNPLGNSPVFRFSFRTSRPSFGCLLNIPLAQPADPEDVIAALSTALRLPAARFIAQTTRAELDAVMAQYDARTMDSPGLIFNALITPNATNDTPPPSYYCDLLMNGQVRAAFASNLPELEPYVPIQSAEFRRQTPRVLEPPYIKALFHYNATIALRLWDSGTVYAIVVPAEDLNATSAAAQS
jgi:hypothetical protein